MYFLRDNPPPHLLPPPLPWVAEVFLARFSVSTMSLRLIRFVQENPLVPLESHPIDFGDGVSFHI